MKIGNLDTDQDIILIAEIGNNHEGNYEVAREMVKAAAESSVDIVKFQTIRTEYLIASGNEARTKQLKSYELTDKQFVELSELAHSLGILFMSTPFDLKVVESLAKISPAFKIASSDNTFYPLISKVFEQDLPVMISTGLAKLEMVNKLLDFIKQDCQVSDLKDRLALLHCISSYPAPENELNLRAITEYRRKYSFTIGYSDHCLGIDSCVVAASLGARIIEKHFTLDHNYSSFRDHQLSANPKEMAELSKRLKSVNQMLGEESILVSESEAKNENAFRRSIAAGKDFPEGHELSMEDLIWVRPGDGFAPGQEDELIGKKLNKAHRMGELILKEALA